MEPCLWAWCSVTTELGLGGILWREDGQEEAGHSQIKRLKSYWSVFSFPRNEPYQESKKHSWKRFLEQVMVHSLRPGLSNKEVRG